MPRARLLIAVIAGAHIAVLLAVAGRYGYHRDELYFLEAGRHLAWGYVDQPPFTPLVARLSSRFLGDGPAALRVIPALATGACVVLGAVIARELGGGRRAQVVAAAMVAGGGFVLGVGHLLSTATFDLLAWMALLAVAARLLRTDDPRWWTAFGAIGGLSMLNKNLAVLLPGALLAGLVVERRWRLLRSPWLVAGAAIALVLAAPNLAWQATNGWPQLDMARAIADRIGGENRALLLPGQLLLLGPLLVVFLVAGARRLWRAEEGRRHRPLLWAWPVALALTFASAGRPYYPLPLTLVVALAGAVALEPRLATRQGRLRIGGLVAVSALLTVPLALPLLPADRLAGSPLAAANDALVETIGWPELVATIAEVADALPAEERDRLVVLTASYGEAGAVDRFGAAHGLPPAHSGHNSYADWRRPNDDRATVISVRTPAPRIAPFFERCEEAARVTNDAGVDNEVAGTPILVCRGLRGSWDDVWPRIRHLS